MSEKENTQYIEFDIIASYERVIKGWKTAARTMFWAFIIWSVLSMYAFIWMSLNWPCR